MEERRDIVYIGIDHIHTHLGESKKGSRRFDGAGRIDEKTGVFTEFNGCSGRRTAWRVLCVDWEPPAWSIKVSRPRKNCHAGSLKD